MHEPGGRDLQAALPPAAQPGQLLHHQLVLRLATRSTHVRLHPLALPGVSPAPSGMYNLRHSSLMLCAPCHDSLHSSVLCIAISTRPILLQLAAVLMDLDLRLSACTFLPPLPSLTNTEAALVHATEEMQQHLCCMLTCMLQLQQVALRLTPLPYLVGRYNRLSIYTAHFSEFPPTVKMSLLSPRPCCCSSVSTRQLEQVDLCKGPMVVALSILSVEVHAGVVAAADKFFLELRRRYASNVHSNSCRSHCGVAMLVKSVQGLSSLQQTQQAILLCLIMLTAACTTHSCAPHVHSEGRLYHGPNTRRRQVLRHAGSTSPLKASWTC